MKRPSCVSSRAAAADLLARFAPPAMCGGDSMPEDLIERDDGSLVVVCKRTGRQLFVSEPSGVEHSLDDEIPF